MKHTPGPWIADDIYIMAGRKNVSVAVVDISGDLRGDHIIPHNEARANAQLIAAVPDFLAACELARKALEHDVPGDCWATGPNTGDMIQDLVICPGCAAIAAIDDAIAKATADSDA